MNLVYCQKQLECHQHILNNLYFSITLSLYNTPYKRFHNNYDNDYDLHKYH